MSADSFQQSRSRFIVRVLRHQFAPECLSKSFVFGGIISLISCYVGFNTSGGARGIGISTTRSVVLSFMLILIADYFLTIILM